MANSRGNGIGEGGRTRLELVEVVCRPRLKSVEVEYRNRVPAPACEADEQKKGFINRAILVFACINWTPR